MKEIKAYIQRRKLDKVTLAIQNFEGLTGMSVLEVKGFGIGWGGTSRPGKTVSKTLTKASK
jgi:nitrogen regulatory protein P-II 1